MDVWTRRDEIRNEMRMLRWMCGQGGMRSELNILEEKQECYKCPRK